MFNMLWGVTYFENTNLPTRQVCSALGAKENSYLGWSGAIVTFCHDLDFSHFVRFLLNKNRTKREKSNFLTERKNSSWSG